MGALPGDLQVQGAFQGIPLLSRRPPAGAPWQDILSGHQEFGDTNPQLTPWAHAPRGMGLALSCWAQPF